MSTNESTTRRSKQRWAVPLRDERINKIDLEATTISGMALMLTVIVAFIVEIAQGKDGLPYSMLGAVAGVAYIAALVVLRFRR
jgi:hypothetical protein